MTGPAISRRRFLTATATTAAAVLGAQALGTNAALAKHTALSPLVLSSDLYASDQPQRFVFAVAKGAHFASFKKTAIAFAAPDSDEGTLLATRLYTQGLPRGRGIYRVDATFPVAGTWKALLQTRGEQVGFVIDVKDAPEAPIAESPAPRAASPTRAAPLGVKPICTRRPNCGLHDVSLDQVIGTGTPVVAMFATPALCQSRYCGPVLDELLEFRTEYADRVHFAHVEIYRSNRGADLSPTVEAWRLMSEPWIFAIDGSGTITERLDGAFASPEIKALFERLTRT